MFILPKIKNLYGMRYLVYNTPAISTKIAVKLPIGRVFHQAVRRKFLSLLPPYVKGLCIQNILTESIESNPDFYLLP